jgi:hypothetical protein
MTGKVQPFQQTVLGKLDIYMQNKNGTLSHTLYKNQLEMDERQTQDLEL